MDLVAAWCQGVRFADLCKMTDVFEVGAVLGAVLCCAVLCQMTDAFKVGAALGTVLGTVLDGVGGWVDGGAGGWAGGGADMQTVWQASHCPPAPPPPPPWSRRLNFSCI
jgi:hypothetical protein